MVIQPGLDYLTRKGWGADTGIPRLGSTVARRDRTEAIIHHTVIVDSDATKNLWTNLAEVKAKMRQLQRIRPDLGLDVPYNFVMFLMEDGTIIVCEGRGLDRSGAHTKGHNYGGLATALQGNFMLATSQGLARFVSGMSRWWGWLRYDKQMVNLGSVHPAGRIAYGHRDFRDPNDTSTWTACPGDNLYVIIPQLEFTKTEEDMPLNAADLAKIKAIAEAAVKPVATDVAALKKSHEGGELPGLWWKVKGVATIWYVDYVNGVLMRHSARNPASYMGVGGDWKVITVTAKQRDATALGAPLPELKV